MMILLRIGEIQKNVGQVVLLHLNLIMMIYVWLNVQQKNHIMILTKLVKQNALILREPSLAKYIIKKETLNVSKHVLLANMNSIMYVIQVLVLLILNHLELLLLTVKILINVFVNINFIKISIMVKIYIHALKMG